MVDHRDPNREDSIIGEDEAIQAKGFPRDPYFENASEIFRDKSLLAVVIGGIGLVILVTIFIVILAKPKNVVAPEHLQSLEARMRQVEKNLAALAVLDQALAQLAAQEQKLDVLDKKLNRLESTVSTQIDQIIKELGVLHQKTAQSPATVAPIPKTVDKQQPLSSKTTKFPTQFHWIRSGETLYRISRRYGLSVEQLRSYNNLAPNAAIYPGQKLKLTPPKTP